MIVYYTFDIQGLAVSTIIHILMQIVSLIELQFDFLPWIFPIWVTTMSPVNTV